MALGVFDLLLELEYGILVYTHEMTVLCGDALLLNFRTEEMRAINY